MENGRTFKSLIVGPSLEFRQEGEFPVSLFGAGSETPVSALIKELHIHIEGDKTTFSLESPIVGGPVVVCSDGKQEVLVPGEQMEFESKNLTIFARKAGHVQIVIFE